MAAVAAAIAGTTLLTAAGGAWRIVAGAIALLAAVFSTLDTTLKAGQLTEEHKRAFDGFTRMRTKWLQFQDITLALGQTDKELAEEFQRLIVERDQLSEQVPPPPEWARTIVAARKSAADNGVSASALKLRERKPQKYRLSDEALEETEGAAR
jgi:hypothetical protein